MSWFFRLLSWLLSWLRAPSPPATPAPSHALRSPGLMETWYCAHPVPHVLFFSVALETTQEISDPLVRLVLDHVVQAHPRLALRYEFVKNVAELKLVDGFGRESLPVSFVKRSDPETWKEVANKELNRKFDVSDPKVPLWRFIVVVDNQRKDPSKPHSCEFIAVFHHLLVDGLSAHTFFQEFFRIYEEVSGPTDGKGVVGFEPLVPANVNIGQKVEDGLDVKAPFSLLLKTLLSSFTKPEEFYWGSNELVVPLEKRQTTLTTFNLPEQKFDALLKACKVRGTSLHAAFVAATNFALAATAQNPYLPTTCETPVSLRKLAFIQDGELGVHVCGCTVWANLAPTTSFWTLAAESKGQIAQALPEAYQKIGLLRHVSDVRAFHQQRMAPQRNDRLSSLEVSNLGVVNLKPTYTNQRGRALKLKGCVFGQANHYEGPLYNLSVVTVNKTLAFSLTVPSPIVSPQQASHFQDIFLLVLSRSAENMDLVLKDVMFA